MSRPGPSEAPDELEDGRWVSVGGIQRWVYDDPYDVADEPESWAKERQDA